MNYDYTNPQSAVVDAEAALCEATASGKWLALVARVEDGRVEIRQITWDFPKDDLAKVLELHRGLIEKELGIERPSPLPRRKNDAATNQELLADDHPTPKAEFPGQNGHPAVERDPSGKSADGGEGESGQPASESNRLGGETGP